jgi:anoctamin-8
LKEEYGGGMKEFNFEDHDCFFGTDDSEEFFNSQERQCIIHYMLPSESSVPKKQS